METTIIIHQVIVVLVVGQLEIVPTALFGPAQTYRVCVLVAGFGHRAVVEGELLAVLDVLD